MFKRFFGETEVEQLSFLQSRVTITFVLIVVGLVGAIFSRTFGLVAVIPFIFIWGKGALSAVKTSYGEGEYPGSSGETDSE